MSNATIDQLTRINTVYVQTIREQDARIAELEAQLAAAQERERVMRDYIAMLENCQDLYYRATETEEAMKYAALAASEKGGAK